MSQIPIGWLMKIDGFEETPLTTGFYDYRWYTKAAPLFLLNVFFIIESSNMLI